MAIGQKTPLAGQYVVPGVAPALAPVAGGGWFPVRRIYCVGRNYAAHAREMGGDPTREPPFFFQKPADAILPDGGTMPYPPATSDLHHEVELVVAIGLGGRDIPVADALAHVYGYAVGLDMTRRDLQAEAKKHGRPWDMAKGFDHSAPLGLIHPAHSAEGGTGHFGADTGAPHDTPRGTIRLTVNGTPRQQADLADMIWSVAETIAALSRLVTLYPGDLIYTGTPDGVAAVQPGDRLLATVTGLTPLAVEIGRPE